MIEFLRPEFGASGFDVTVRNGTKWADLVPGERILVGCSIQGVSAHAIVLGAFTVEGIENIPAVVLKHDFRGCTPESLKAAMDEAYPSGWGPTLTIVAFLVDA